MLSTGSRSRLVLAFKSGAIATLSLPELIPGHRLENAHLGSVSCLAPSPDGRILATGGDDHRIVLRDPLTFEPLLCFPEWTRTLRDMEFDCASDRLAIAGTDSDLELWSIAALNRVSRTPVWRGTNFYRRNLHSMARREPCFAAN